MRLRGQMLPVVGQLTHLTYLALNNNNISGTLPAELSQLGALQHLILHRNLIEGACV